MLGKKVADPADKTKKIHYGEGVWFEINRALPAPMELRQLQQILEDLAPDDFGETILSLDRVLALENPGEVERTDLILLGSRSAANRKAAVPLLHWQSVPHEYRTGRDLQVVEVTSLVAMQSGK